MGGSVKVTFAFLAKLTHPPFLHHQAWQEAAQVYTPQDHSGFGHLPTMAGHLFGPAFRSLGDVAMDSVSRALALFLGLAA